MIHAPTTLERVPLVQETRVILPPLNKKVDMDWREAFDYSEKRSRDEYFVPLGYNVGGAQAAEETALLRPANTIREVQLLVPAGIPLFWDLDTYPEDLGPDRVYKLPDLPANVRIKIKLMPNQWIVASTDRGTGTIGMLVEYHKNDLT